LSAPYPFFYWPASGVVDTTVVPNVLRVIVWHALHTDVYPYFILINMSLATFSLPGLQLQGPPQALPSTEATHPYGFTAFLNADGDVYLYGMYQRNHYLARAPVAQMTDASRWQYWAGRSWAVAAPRRAVPLAWPKEPDAPGNPVVRSHAAGWGSGPWAPLSVTPYGSGYLGTSKRAGVLGRDVSVFTASRPQGPWTYAGQVATTPDPTPGGAGDGSFSFGVSLALSCPSTPTPWTCLPGARGPTLIYSTNDSGKNPRLTIQTYGPHFLSPRSLPAVRR
jgi:hypothetical protein